MARKTIWGVYYDAAHTRGPALALWDTEDKIEVVERDGPQDFALGDGRMLPRIQQAALSIGIRVRLTAVCRH